MTQPELCRAVARATGESARLIRRMGFSLVPAPRHRKAARRSGAGQAARDSGPADGCASRAR